MKTLWPHQQDALDYTKRAQHPALYMDMRLGKTLVAVRRILQYPLQGRFLRALVVGPGCVLQEWQDTVLSEQGGDQKVFRLDEPRKAVRQNSLVSAVENPGDSWCLINKEGHRALPEIRDVLWDAVVLDEGTFIKDPRTLTTKFYLRNFRSAQHRWILTGTPNPESDLDFIPQLLWLHGSVAGYPDFWKWRSAFCYVDRYEWMPNTQGRFIIKSELAAKAFFLRRKDININLPFVREVREISLPAKVIKVYKKAEKDFILESADPLVRKSTIFAVVRYTWLKDICNGFAGDQLLHTEKFDAVRDLLRGELQKDPVLIWFTSNKALYEVRRRLCKARILCDYITGDCSRIRRAKVIREAQRGKVRCLLLQVKCAEFGLNLSAFDTVVYFDLPTSAQTYQQSFERTLHLEKKTPTLYIYLVVKNSVDHDAMDGLALKKFQANSLISLVRRMKERNQTQ